MKSFDLKNDPAFLKKIQKSEKLNESSIKVFKKPIKHETSGPSPNIVYIIAFGVNSLCTVTLPEVSVWFLNIAFNIAWIKLEKSTLNLKQANALAQDMHRLVLEKVMIEDREFECKKPRDFDHVKYAMKKFKKRLLMHYKEGELITVRDNGVQREVKLTFN